MLVSPNNSAPESVYEISRYDPEWEIDRNGLQMISVLGEGQFGQVSKAKVIPESRADEQMVIITGFSTNYIYNISAWNMLLISIQSFNIPSNLRWWNL